MTSYNFKLLSQTFLYPDIEIDYLFFVRNLVDIHIDMNQDCYDMLHLRRMFDHFRYIHLNLRNNFLYLG